MTKIEWAIEWFENSIAPDHKKDCEDCRANKIALKALIEMRDREQECKKLEEKK